MMWLTGKLFLTMVYLHASFASRSVNLHNSYDTVKCRGTDDYDLKGYNYMDIYSTGTLKTSLCHLTFESESYPKKLTVEFIQPIRAKSNSRFFILFQTRNSKHMPWGGDRRITASSRLVTRLYFSRRLSVTISGNIGEDVRFRIRVRTSSTSRVNRYGHGSGLARWAIGVIVLGIVIFLFASLIGGCAFRRYRSGQGFFGRPGFFQRSHAPPVVTYTANQTPFIANAPPPIYSPNNNYPTHSPSAPPPMATGPMPPPMAAGPAPPPPPGFVYPPSAPPPYTPTPNAPK